MLVADDDDFGLDGLETFEAEALEAEREAHALMEAATAEPADQEPLPDVVTREHFVLLPLVTKLIHAHASNNADDIAAAMKELRRGVRRAERMLGMLEASAGASATAIDAVTARESASKWSELLDQSTSRKRPRTAEGAPARELQHS